MHSHFFFLLSLLYFFTKWLAVMFFALQRLDDGRLLRAPSVVKDFLVLGRMHTADSDPGVDDTAVGIQCNVASSHAKKRYRASAVVSASLELRFYSNERNYAGQIWKRKTAVAEGSGEPEQAQAEGPCYYPPKQCINFYSYVLHDGDVFSLLANGRHRFKFVIAEGDADFDLNLNLNLNVHLDSYSSSRPRHHTALPMAVTSKKRKRGGAGGRALEAKCLSFPLDVGSVTYPAKSRDMRFGSYTKSELHACFAKERGRQRITRARPPPYRIPPAFWNRGKADVLLRDFFGVTCAYGAGLNNVLATVHRTKADAKHDTHGRPYLDEVVQLCASKTSMLACTAYLSEIVPRVWTPETHKHFPRKFRSAVFAILLVQNRCAQIRPAAPLFLRSIWPRVLSFIQEDAYYDGRCVDNVYNGLCDCDCKLHVCLKIPDRMFQLKTDTYARENLVHQHLSDTAPVSKLLANLHLCAECPEGSMQSMAPCLYPVRSVLFKRLVREEHEADQGGGASSGSAMMAMPPSSFASQGPSRLRALEWMLFREKRSQSIQKQKNSGDSLVFLDPKWREYALPGEKATSIYQSKLNSRVWTTERFHEDAHCVLGGVFVDESQQAKAAQCISLICSDAASGTGAGPGVSSSLENHDMEGGLPPVGSVVCAHSTVHVELGRVESYVTKSKLTQTCDEEGGAVVAARVWFRSGRTGVVPLGMIRKFTGSGAAYRALFGSLLKRLDVQIGARMCMPIFPDLLMFSSSCTPYRYLKICISMKPNFSSSMAVYQQYPGVCIDFNSFEFHKCVNYEDRKRYVDNTSCEKYYAYVNAGLLPFGYLDGGGPFSVRCTNPEDVHVRCTNPEDFCKLVHVGDVCCSSSSFSDHWGHTCYTWKEKEKAKMQNQHIIFDMGDQARVRSRVVGFSFSSCLRGNKIPHSDFTTVLRQSIIQSVSVYGFVDKPDQNHNQNGTLIGHWKSPSLNIQDEDSRFSRCSNISYGIFPECVYHQTKKVHFVGVGEVTHVDSTSSRCGGDTRDKFSCEVEVCRWDCSCGTLVSCGSNPMKPIKLKLSISGIVGECFSLLGHSDLLLNKSTTSKLKSDLRATQVLVEKDKQERACCTNTSDSNSNKNNNNKKNKNKTKNISGKQIKSKTKKRTLVVCPTSLLGDWEQKIKQYSALRVYVHRGDWAFKFVEGPCSATPADFDVCVTDFET